MEDVKKIATTKTINDLEITTPDIEIDDKLLINGIENQQDLRDCLSNIEQELQQISQLTVEDCINNGDKIADLANEIEECDGILEVFLKIFSKVFMFCPQILFLL